jgi:uncharacterized lipoprotein YehR (DUF1307 family)
MQQLYKPIVINFKNLRTIRQQNNNKIIYDSIKSKNTKEFDKNINHKDSKEYWMI